MKFQKRTVQSGSGDSAFFFKLKDGEAKSGVLRGEIFEFYIKWINNKSVQTTIADPQAKSRFKVNLVVYEEGAFKAKIWEFGVLVYNKIADIAEEYDVTKTKIKISRQGTGTDTEYHLLPLLKEPLTPSVLSQIEAVKLNILDGAKKVEMDADGFPPDFGDPPPGFQAGDEIPF